MLDLLLSEFVGGSNINDLEVLFRRAAGAGYTHVLLADSKFAKLGTMDARYFRNVDRVKQLAAELKLELVPALFSIGYSMICSFTTRTSSKRCRFGKPCWS